VGLAAEALADAILERGARVMKPMVERIGEGSGDAAPRAEVMRAG
jgi:hypothetical protein